MKSITFLKRIKAKKIFVQFPEGLKTEIQSISKYLEDKGFDVILSCESTYGACDIRDDEAKRLKCDAILHIGHSDFGVKSKIPVIYWEYFYDIDPIPVLKKEYKKISKYNKIGLITNVQFIKSLKSVKEFLKTKEKKIFTNKSLNYSGQILGCNVEAAKKIENKVDCFLYIGSGNFYALGLDLKINKPIFILDLEKKVIRQLDSKKLKQKIEWNKSFFKEAKKIGILVSWKKGQIRDFWKLKKKLKDKEVYILAFDEITPEKLEGLKLDFLINCACPRIGIDDISRYKIPIVNYNDLNDI